MEPFFCLERSQQICVISSKLDAPSFQDIMDLKPTALYFLTALILSVGVIVIATSMTKGLQP